MTLVCVGAGQQQVAQILFANHLCCTCSKWHFWMRSAFVLDDETLTQGIFIEKGLNVTMDLFVFVCWHRVFIMFPGTDTKHSLHKAL